MGRATEPIYVVCDSAYSTRKALLRCFDHWIERKPNQHIWWVAEREYIGKEWFKQLLLRKMQFCIRLRKNVTLTHHHKKIKPHELFECATLRTLSKPRKLYGTVLYLAGQKLPDGHYFIVGSATKTKRLAHIYEHRWQIETLFGAFKSPGFNLESCRVNLAKRIKTLIFVLSLSAVWALRTGQWLLKQGKNIPLKTFKDKPAEKLKSLFRWGLDHLQNLTLNNLDFKSVIHKSVIQLCHV
jgi:transposase